MCADGCDEARVTDEHGEQRMQCVGGANDGMEYGKIAMTLLVMN